MYSEIYVSNSNGIRLNLYMGNEFDQKQPQMSVVINKMTKAFKIYPESIRQFYFQNKMR